jgi:HemY protein
MIRFLVLLALFFAIVSGFEWLKDAPGELALTVGGTTYAIGLARAALAFSVAVIAAVITLWLLRLVLRAPRKTIDAWTGRRVEKGRNALTQGLLAIASGDIRTAERAAAEAAKRSPDMALMHLLQAQTAQSKGDHEAARQAFAAMLEWPETRVVGLRGLHIEAEREGDHVAARHYAQEAHRIFAGAPWATRALLRYQTGDGDWDGALGTLAVAGDKKAVDKKTARRHRAVILAARAMEAEDGDPEAAQQAALEAHNIEPGLVAAAVIAGRVLTRLGEVRRATKVLEAAWKANPHPEIAEAYAHVRPGDSARDRLRRMETLTRLKPQADEGRIALAQAAMEARDWARARETLIPVVRTRPTQGSLLLMAEVEEGEHGDLGRAREWLSRAVHAPRDPAWVADGMVLQNWAPVSPVSGLIDAVEWKVPAEQLGGPAAIDIDDAKRESVELISAKPAEPDQSVEAEGETPLAGPAGDGEIIAAEEQAAVTTLGDATVVDVERPDEPVEKAAEAKVEAENALTAETGNGADDSETVIAAGDDVINVAVDDSGSVAPEPVPASEAALAEKDDVSAPKEPRAAELAKSQELGGEKNGQEADALLDLPRPPDDPGVEEIEIEPPSRRFKLF